MVSLEPIAIVAIVRAVPTQWSYVMILIGNRHDIDRIRPSIVGIILTTSPIPLTRGNWLHYTVKGWWDVRERYWSACSHTNVWIFATPFVNRSGRQGSSLRTARIVCNHFKYIGAARAPADDVRWSEPECFREVPVPSKRRVYTVRASVNIFSRACC